MIRRFREWLGNAIFYGIVMPLCRRSPEAREAVLHQLEKDIRKHQS